MASADYEAGVRLGIVMCVVVVVLDKLCEEWLGVMEELEGEYLS